MATKAFVSKRQPAKGGTQKRGTQSRTLAGKRKDGKALTTKSNNKRDFSVKKKGSPK